MKKLFAVMLVLCMVLGCTCASASTFEALQEMLRNSSQTTAAEAPAAEAPAGGDGSLVTDCRDGLEIVKNNVFAIESNSYVYVYVFLEVTNTSTYNVEVDGELAALDAQGTVLEDQSYLYAYPSVIAPGETAYVGEYMMISKSNGLTCNDVAQVKINLFRDAYNRDPALLTYAQSAVEVGPGTDKYGYTVDNMFRVVAVNTTGADLVNPYVVVAMYDAQGNLLYVEDDRIGGSGDLIIPNGNGFMVSGSMDGDISEYLKSEGITVTEAKCVVYGN